ncbi:MAG TPA: hypothetical protein VGJ75_03200 [Dongiaceae bacterium]|jgi:hypothetical protein
MIVIITATGHEYALAPLAKGGYGFPVPPVRITTYERLLTARRVRRATYIFTDLDRLAPWELRLAADLYRRMREAKLTCLNNPARAMSRFELLRALHRAGVNPFDVYRADEQPRPKRFPVFLRPEDSHRVRKPELLVDQDALDAALEQRRQLFRPLRGGMVIEYCPAPYDAELWCKWGTFKVGAAMSVDHIGVEKHWFVKYGVWEMLTDAVVADEHDAVTSNRFAADVEKAFAVAGIEFGRADHAIVDGRTVIYEINTNPRIWPYVRDKFPLRQATQTLARERLAAALDAIDCKKSGSRRLAPSTLFRTRRSWTVGAKVPLRP